MSNWIEMNTFDLANKGDKSFSSSTSNIMLSPYYVPDALRSYLDESKNNIIIEFRYIPVNEQTEIHHGQHGVTFEVGEKTERIYKVFINIALIDKENLSNAIVQALETAVLTFINQKRAMSKTTSKYMVNLSAIKDYSKPLKEGLHLDMTG